MAVSNENVAGASQPDEASVVAWLLATSRMHNAHPYNLAAAQIITDLRCAISDSETLRRDQISSLLASEEADRQYAIQLRALLAEAVEHLALLSDGEQDDPDTGIVGWNDCHRVVAESRAALAKNPNGTSQVGGERQRAIKEPGQSTSALRYPGSNPGDDPAPSDSALTGRFHAIHLTLNSGRCKVAIEVNKKWITVIEDGGSIISHIVEPLGIQRRVDEQRTVQHQEKS